MKKLLMLFNLLLVAQFLQAQSTITGKITDAKNNEPLIGATVMIKGTTIGANTDLEGNYMLKIPNSGKVTVIATYVSYKADTVVVNLTPGEKMVLNFKMNEVTFSLKGVVISDTRKTSTETAVIMEIKNADHVVNGISSEQIAKTQDRTAGDVIKRMPGVTIQNDRFVMIRGLADRYNTVLLDGAIPASLESDKKAFSFDLIPSGTLDRMLIYKTGAAEIPGDFAGGVVKVYTRNMPDSNFAQINYSIGYRASTTGNNFLYGAQNSLDFIGFGANERALPNGFPVNLNLIDDNVALANISKTLPNTWQLNNKSAAPDQRFGFNLGWKKDMSKLKIGNTTTFNYSNSREAFKARNINYNVFDIIQQRSDSINDYHDANFNNMVRLGASHNWAFVLSPEHKIEFKNLFTLLSSNETIERTGVNFEEGFDVKNYAFRFRQRQIYNGQLSGAHKFKGEVINVDWLLRYANASNKEPDFQRIRTIRDINSNENVPYDVVIAPAASNLDAGRFYSNLNEDIKTFAANIEFKPVPKNVKWETKYRTGVYTELKDRKFEARWMSYKKANFNTFDNKLLRLPIDQLFNSENINPTTGFTLVEGTNPSDRYFASNSLLAAYAGMSLGYLQMLNLSYGVRAEYNVQNLNSRNYQNQPIVYSNPVLSILPSLNASYKYTDKSLVRFAYSRTVNRPEFREIAPFAYYDFVFNNVLYGNDSLQNASIDNFDLRWENYPSTRENISVAVFYKNFTNPIEMFFVPGTGSGGTRNFTFSNAKAATALGFEIETRKMLGKLENDDFWSNTGVLFNASFIRSRVDLGENAVGQSQNRPLMGQSNYVINAGLFFNPSDKLQVSALYNVIGPRLFAVGTFGTPDIYEMPRNVIDLSASYNLSNKLQVKIGTQDLLNQYVRLLQDGDEDGAINNSDQLIWKYRKGSYYTLSLIYRI